MTRTLLVTPAEMAAGWIVRHLSGVVDGVLYVTTQGRPIPDPTEVEWTDATRHDQ